MRTYSSGSGMFHVPGASPVAHLAAAHEVGHELEPRAVPGEQERTRRGLAIELGDRRPEPWPKTAARRRRRARSRSAGFPTARGRGRCRPRARLPSPKTRSAGATAGVADEVSSFCRRLPARISTFDPSRLRLLTRASSVTRTERWRLPPSFRHTRSAPAAVSATMSLSPSASRSATATSRSEDDVPPDRAPTALSRVTSIQRPPAFLKRCVPRGPATSRSSRPSLS